MSVRIHPDVSLCESLSFAFEHRKGKNYKKCETFAVYFFFLNQRQFMRGSGGAEGRKPEGGSGSGAETAAMVFTVDGWRGKQNIVLGTQV